MHGGFCKIATSTGTYIGEFAVLEIRENHVRLLDTGSPVSARIEDVGRRHEQIFPAIVVEIEYSVAPAALVPCRRGHTAFARDFLKKTFTSFAKQAQCFFPQG